jgi:hypothetical protein
MEHTLSYDLKNYYLDGKLLLPFKSQDVRNHSPDGFNHGYGGSGPAQLALAIMLETEKHYEIYQEFKWAVIANLPHGRFTIKFKSAGGSWKWQHVKEEGDESTG